MNYITLLILSTLTCSMLFIFLWAYAKKINNYSIVDAAWALAFTAVAALYAVLGSGWIVRRLVILACVSLWSLRLGSFLFRRIRSHHPHEDGRYLDLRTRYQPHVAQGFFWFFQYQAWSIALLSTPFLMASVNPEPRLRFVEIAGALVFSVSLLGEAVADAQMNRFKNLNENKKKTCQVGLWKYSRHPNYFFESCIWWGFYLFALGSTGGIFTLYCPLLILFLLLKVTGVPLAEAQALKSRGDEYRQYQKTTSAFVPWLRRSHL